MAKERINPRVLAQHEQGPWFNPQHYAIPTKDIKKC